MVAPQSSWFQPPSIFLLYYSQLVASSSWSKVGAPDPVITSAFLPAGRGKWELEVLLCLLSTQPGSYKRYSCNICLNLVTWSFPATRKPGKCGLYSGLLCAQLKSGVLWTSLVPHRLRICLPMQGTRVWTLVWEDPTCRRATKPVRHNYWARALQLLKPTCLEEPRALQQERPRQWEACAPQRRVAPAHCN